MNSLMYRKNYFIAAKVPTDLNYLITTGVVEFTS